MQTSPAYEKNKRKTNHWEPNILHNRNIETIIPYRT